MTTWPTAAAVLATAQSLLGTGEEPDGSNHNFITEAYGIGDGPWCAMFVWYCFQQNGVDLRQELTTDFAWTPSAANAARARGWWHDGLDGIQAGDAVLYKIGDTSEINHIGLWIGDGETVDGNWGNHVRDVWHDPSAAVGYIAFPFTPADEPSGSSVPIPAPTPDPTPARYQATINGLAYGYGAHGSQVTLVGQALVAHGFGSHYQQGPGPDWSDADTLNYADYQRSLGYSGSDADGVPGETTLRQLLGYLPGGSVSLANVIDAAQTDPGAEQGHQSHPDDVRPVEQALLSEGLLAAEWAGDGSFGRLTVEAYAAWQRSLGYSGSNADGIPGHDSLAELGNRHGFTVTD